VSINRVFEHLAESVDSIIDEFLQAYRSGTNPSVDVYCERYKQFSTELRPALSMAILLEKARGDTADDLTIDSIAKGTHFVGTSLGDYQILREAGRGGMGIVFEAVEQSLNRRVAIKILPRPHAHDASMIERFKREAKAVASLHHTNIVPVFAVGEENGVLFYVMPFVNGKGLDKVLQELRQHKNPLDNHSLHVAETNGKTLGSSESRREFLLADTPHALETSNTDLPQVLANSNTPSIGPQNYWRRVSRIGIQVADALEYAFQQGVLHRDIKPSNLILDNAGVVWVTDFGLAKVSECDDLTKTGELLGTLRYVAPEKFAGVYDIRGEVYALGVTLYELLTFASPFSSTDKAVLAKQILERAPPRPRSINPKIPADLETIVLKAIAKDPRDRYQTAAALAEDLRLFIEDRPILSRRASSFEHVIRWSRRNPVTSGLIACISLLMATMIAVLFVSNSRIRHESALKTAALVEKDSAIIAKQIAIDAKKAALDDRELAYEQSRFNERLARQRSYAARVTLAGQAYHSGDVTRAEDLLSSIEQGGSESEFCGFEYFYLKSALRHGLLRTVRHPGSEIAAMSFSPDGKRLLVTGGSFYDGVLSVHDVATGDVVFGPRVFECNLNACGFAPDGSAFAVGHGSGMLQVYDAATFELLHVDNRKKTIKSLAWSYDSKQLAVGYEDGALRLLCTPSFESVLVEHAHQGPIMRLFFTRDDQHLYTSADWGGESKMTRRWDVSRSRPVEDAAYPNQSIADVTVDGTTLAGMDWGELQLVDSADGERLAKRSISTGPLAALQFAPNHNLLLAATRNDRAVHCFDPVTLVPANRISQRHTVSALAIDPNEKYWAAGDAEGNVRIWEFTNDDLRLELPDAHANFVAFLEATEQVIVGGEKNSFRWDINDRATLSHDDSEGLLAISHDASVSACVHPGDDKSYASRVVIRKLGDEDVHEILLKRPVYNSCFALSPSGRWLATRSESQPIELYDLNTSPTIPTHELVSPSYHFAFSPDSSQLVCGEQFGVVSAFAVESGKPLGNYTESESFWSWGMSIAFSRDGKFIASGNESGLVRVWETQSRKLVASLLGQAGEIRTLAFFPDNVRIAVGGTGDVRIWDFQSGQELLALPIEGSKVVSLTVSQSGNSLAAALPKGGVVAWTSATSNAIDY